jgi:glycosyl transferase family 25
MSASIQIRVINLASSTDRMALIAKDLESAGLQWERLEAVELGNSAFLSQPLYNRNRALSVNNRDLTKGELGCFLSHMAALNQFLDGTSEYLLVLEDDVLVSSEAASHFLELPQLLDGKLGNSWHCANLTMSYNKRFRTLFTFDSIQLRRAFYFPLTTSALLWTRQGARDFRDSVLRSGIFLPVDDQVRSHLAKTGLGLSLSRPLFELRSFPTTIASRPSVRQGILSSLKKKVPNYLHAYRNQLRYLFLKIFLSTL